MSIQNLIINGSFETGTLTSWTSANTTVTSQFSHSGSFSARFQSSPFTSYIGQFVPLNSGESMEVLASFAKVGTAPSTPVFIQVTFYDSLSNFLGVGLGTTIPVDHIPTADNDTWLEIYQTTTPAPPNTTQAFILIHTSPQAGTANVLVDDVALLIAPDTGGGVIPAYGSLITQPGAGLFPTPGTNVDFSVNGPFNGVTPNTADNSITVNSSGVYTISFSTIINAGGSAGVTDSVSFRLSINGIPDLTKQIEFQTVIATTNEVDTLSRTDQLALNQGDVIRVFIPFSTGTITYSNAALVVTKVS